ncbi:MAG TPA: TldD/PmbA family protein, partial [Bacillota bacterium]|nr:TldD/PmbA family protein [Bacillota bacterium]
AASGKTDDAEVQKLAARAVKLAQAASLITGPKVQLAPVPVVTGSFHTEVGTDPFEVPLVEKLDLLQKTTAAPVNDDIKLTQAELRFFKETTEFASTEGSYYTQEIVQSGAGVTTKAVKSGLVGSRSYPAGLGGNQHAAGYEFIEKLDLPGQQREIRKEAVQLLEAPACPNQVTDVIIDSSQMALQIHESCGHPLELDRINGSEISLAGGSFVKTTDRGNLVYAAPNVNIVADATVKGGLGTFGVDDEGVPAQRVFLVRNGLLTNFLTSRETAGVLNSSSNGAMRADGWRNLPVIRMTNINLEPGDWSIDEMIREIQNGILMKTNSSWSIDDLRLNFQFATEIGYRVKNGSIVGIVKQPIYAGRTPEFWCSCDAVGADWQLWGIDNCGKGDPLQIMRVSHGTPSARFRNVKVGS